MSSVAVVIVNYNSAALTVAAVESIFAFPPPGVAVETHIVENASSGDDAVVLRDAIAANGWDASVTLYAEDENHGFGRGNNLALRELAKRDAPPDYVFLLNPDARLTHDVLSPLITELRGDEDIGFAGAAVAHPDGHRLRAAFRFPGIASTFAGAVSFGPISRLFSRYEVAMPAETPTGPVDWVVGAGLLIRFDVLQDLGFFDPAYFLYYEEVDLMLRGRRKGWRTVHVAEAMIEHFEGVSTGVKSGRAEKRRSPGYLYDSWRIYFGGNHGRIYLALATCAWIVGATLNIFIAAILRRQAVAPARFFHDIWSIVIRPQLGLRPRHD